MPKLVPIPGLGLTVYPRTLRPAVSIHRYYCGTVITRSGYDDGRLDDHECLSTGSVVGRVANSEPPRWLMLCSACAYPEPQATA